MEKVKQPFNYYEELDKVDIYKLKRTTTLTQTDKVVEYEYEDFYEEIEHLIRQENIQQNSIRGFTLNHGTAAVQSLNDQSFHRSTGQNHFSHQQKLFHLISNQNLGGEEKVWKCDADSGYLSYEKMLYERN